MSRRRRRRVLMSRHGCVRTGTKRGEKKTFHVRADTPFRQVVILPLPRQRKQWSISDYLERTPVRFWQATVVNDTQSGSLSLSQSGSESPHSASAHLRIMDNPCTICFHLCLSDDAKTSGVISTRTDNLSLDDTATTGENGDSPTNSRPEDALKSAQPRDPSTFPFFESTHRDIHSLQLPHPQRRESHRHCEWCSIDAQL